MLEWMHDANVTRNLQANFSAKELADCEAFITGCKSDSESEHFAITNEADEYQGTVSLKHINTSAKSAEFAIAFRSGAMGHGYSKYGMREIIRWGFENLMIDSIYWCVSPLNHRAVRFYDKNGYERIDVAPTEVMGYTKEQIADYIWYQVNKK